MVLLPHRVRGPCIKLLLSVFRNRLCNKEKLYNLCWKCVKGRISACHKFNDKVLKWLFFLQQAYTTHHFKTVVFHDIWYMHWHGFLLYSKVINFYFKCGINFPHKASLIHNSSISMISTLNFIYVCQYSIPGNLALTSSLHVGTLNFNVYCSKSGSVPLKST